MDFNIREIKAMTTIAVYAAAIDGEFDKSEMMVVAEHICALVNSKEEAIVLVEEAKKNMSFEEAVEICKIMSMLEKRYLCALIGSVILADGIITNSELEFWRRLTSVVDLPIMSLEEAAQIYVANIGIAKMSKGYSCSNGSSVNSSNSGCCLVIAIPIILVTLIAISVDYLA